MVRERDPHIYPLVMYKHSLEIRMNGATLAGGSGCVVDNDTLFQIVTLLRFRPVYFGSLPQLRLPHGPLLHRASLPLGPLRDPGGPRPHPFQPGHQSESDRAPAELAARPRLRSPTLLRNEESPLVRHLCCGTCAHFSLTRYHGVGLLLDLSSVTFHCEERLGQGFYVQAETQARLIR